MVGKNIYRRNSPHPKDEGVTNTKRFAHEQNAVPGIPPVVEPVVVEDTPTTVTPHDRDVARAVVHRGRAESDEIDQLGVSLLEFVFLFVGGGAIAVRSHLRALGEAPGDPLLALPVTTNVVNEEDLVARGLHHVRARGVELPGPTVEDGRDVVLAELLLQVGQGWHRSVGNMDTVVVRRECIRYHRRVAVVHTALKRGWLRERSVVVVQNELDYAPHRRLAMLRRETRERFERHAELSGELLECRRQREQPSERPYHERPISFFVLLHGLLTS